MPSVLFVGASVSVIAALEHLFHRWRFTGSQSGAVHSDSSSHRDYPSSLGRDQPMTTAVNRPIRGYRRRGGRPGLNVDFVAVCDAVRKARNGSGDTMTDIAARFGVSRGWLYKWVYPAVDAAGK